MSGEFYGKEEYKSTLSIKSSKSRNNIDLGNKVFFYIGVVCPLLDPKGSIMLFEK